MGDEQERVLLRSDSVTRSVYGCCSWIETNMPTIAARLWQYPIIVVDKPKNPS